MAEEERAAVGHTIPMVDNRTSEGSLTQSCVIIICGKIPVFLPKVGKTEFGSTSQKHYRSMERKVESDRLFAETG